MKTVDLTSWRYTLNAQFLGVQRFALQAIPKTAQKWAVFGYQAKQKLGKYSGLITGLAGLGVGLGVGYFFLTS